MSVPEVGWGRGLQVNKGLYSEVQCIMGNGNIWTSHGQTENVAFPATT